jgi:hypothetical protein
VFLLGQCGDQKWWDGEGVKIQIQKAHALVIQLHQVWKVREIFFVTELRIFRSLFFIGAKHKVNKENHKGDVDMCLRKMIQSFWHYLK